MEYIEALTEYRPAPAVFLAGGITGCPDWQSTVCELLGSLDVFLLNPRRENFPIDDPTAATKQIGWEFRHLRKADAILFWFPKETLCPIVLYELGFWAAHRTTPGIGKSIFVGCHPEYQRRRDVEIQLGLIRPEVDVHNSVEQVVEDVRRWLALSASPFSFS